MLVKADNLSVVETKKGGLSLRVKGNDGSLKTLHSLYDPEAEAKTIVDAFQFDGKGILVVLGLGLGYHIAELSRRFPEAEIIVVEAMSEIYELAKVHGPPLEERIEFVIGLSSEEALLKITQHQIKQGLVSISVFALSAVASAFPNYYRPILTLLRNTMSIRLWDRLRYAKFKRDVHKILLIDSGYFLVREVDKALKALGHDVIKIQVKIPPVSPPGKGGIEGGYIRNNDGMVSAFIEAILNFRPDFILTVNHLGFDEAGVLTGFFQSIEMPVASWYVDSPNLIVRAFDKNVSPYVSLFLWDRSYMSDMESMGFESVVYLPLGTDENLFKPVKKHKRLNKHFCDVGFVGNSMVEPVDEWMSKVIEDIHPLIDKVAEKLVCADCSLPALLTEMQNGERSVIERFSEKEKMDFEAAVLWKATMLYRLSCIRMLYGFDVRIYGDNGWKTLLKSDTIKLYSPLNYYKELPLFYNACKINFNATSRQMSEAVNQRVFDVPACGAFLLTDHQDALNELFNMGEEIITYKHKAEIPEIINYYLKNSEERHEVAMKGRERVLKEHTYSHRLVNLIQFMKRRYK